MGDLTAKCDWHDSTLSIVLPEDPERIAVRLFDSRHAPARLYVPEVDALRLQAENAKLRELLVGAFEDMDAWQKVIAGSNEWGYGKGCLDHLCKLRDAMQELGMEVEVR